jgi:Putative transposase of IS4/5 family (DUF4096)
VPALPSWLVEPLWVQFEALLPKRPMYDPAHPLGCHRRRINDRIIFDKLLQVLRFGCSYEGIADTTCSATTIRNRRDEWIKTGGVRRTQTARPGRLRPDRRPAAGRHRGGRLHHQGARWR